MYSNLFTDLFIEAALYFCNSLVSFYDLTRFSNYRFHRSPRAIISFLPRRNHKSGSNSNAVAWRDSHRGIKQKVVRQASQANALRKKEANKGRSRLPWRLQGSFEGHCSFIGRNRSCSLSVFLLYTTSAPTFVFGTRYGRPVCCRKKAGLLQPSLAPLSVLLLTFPVLILPLCRRTNDQRNVNRKPREATLINPTEINCSAQRRSVALSLARWSSFSLSHSHGGKDSTALGIVSRKNSECSYNLL